MSDLVRFTNFYMLYGVIQMIRKAFRMKLKPGNEAEYKKRHDEIWPELSQELSAF